MSAELTLARPSSRIRENREIVLVHIIVLLIRKLG